MLRIAGVVLIFCWLFPLRAANTISVATDEWLNYANPDGSGYYFSLLQRIFPDALISPHFVPFPRSIALLNNEVVDVAFGGASDDFKHAYCSEFAVEVDRTDMLVSAQFASSYREITDLVGKKVVTSLGYEWDDVLPRGVIYQEYADLGQMLRLLALGRVDALLEYREDIEPLLAKELGVNDLVFFDSVLQYDSRFCFAHNARGRQLQVAFDVGISKLIANGELRRLMIEQLGNDENYPY